jgi:hypothetical protein
VARPKIPTINWRSEFSRLNNYFQNDGGVIHIKTTQDSPSSAFVKALRSRMEHEKWEIPWQTIQIEGNNAATHYLSDIINQIERSIGIITPSTAKNHNINIAADIEAGGDVEISNITVNYGQNGGNLHARADQIAKTILSISEEKRTCIIFFDSDNADPKELTAFRTLVWDDKLEHLLSKGLLLIIFSEQNSDIYHWAPEPDVILELPDRYSVDSARNAIEDITVFAITQKLFASSEEAQTFATTLVASHPNPKELHANFAGVLSRIGDFQ